MSHLNRLRYVSVQQSRTCRNNCILRLDNALCHTSRSSALSGEKTNSNHLPAITFSGSRSVLLVAPLKTQHGTLSLSFWVCGGSNRRRLQVSHISSRNGTTVGSNAYLQKRSVFIVNKLVSLHIVTYRLTAR
jgi:hypothetical protein